MNPVVAHILASLQPRGWLRFDQFMALALYCPGSGYYEQNPDNPGRRGDYYTSVSVGPLFAELLAFQLADWLQTLAARTGPDTTLLCVEAAAHDGRLARQILEWFAQHRPQLARRLRYLILEPSPRRRAWQQATLGPWAEQVDWPGTPTDPSHPNAPEWFPLPPRSVTGVIFANEFLDALPVRRLRWNARAGHWSEWGVTWQKGRFSWTVIPDPPEAVRERADLLRRFGIEPPPELLNLLPDGFTLDLSPAALAWWEQAAQSLVEGWLLTFDYGLSAEECLHPARATGTLRAYYRHHLAPDPLERPGEQDLTAHVAFTALERAGRAAGLTTVLRQPQGRFLSAIATRWAEQNQGHPGWDAARLRQFHTLTHPDHLGHALQAFVQHRCPSLNLSPD
ncbi:hypothetical protein G4L39_12835 [Limisphaera ngatamarikiensis]|uniref:SAM-dependent methyltransferase n=1 Tax=Limisphaera ngatamarikiensis TaxID=1324935 RepID=A0A6M1RRM8_9BACT|nr:hypothetical protein [Limisphaera ngatamarikiensis]